VYVRQLVESTLEIDKRLADNVKDTYSHQRDDNGHFLQTSQNCFVYRFMRSLHVRDILIFLRRL